MGWERGVEVRAEVGVTGKSCTREHCSDSGRGRSSCIRLHCKPASQGGVPRGSRERPYPRLEAVLNPFMRPSLLFTLICAIFDTLFYSALHPSISFSTQILHPSCPSPHYFSPSLPRLPFHHNPSPPRPRHLNLFNFYVTDQSQRNLVPFLLATEM